MSAPADLAERLRAGTQELHSQTERAGMMPTLLRGELARERYCALLRNLHALYAALESALTQHSAHAEVAPVVFPALFRQDSLADDLDALHGSEWPQAFALQPAMQRYVERLQGLSAEQPALLAAHAYVRYLGDLSGGQALRRIVARAYPLADDAGARFYDFGPADAVRTHARRFRDGLGAIDTDAPRTEALVAEARWAFAQHGELFEQLANAP